MSENPQTIINLYILQGPKPVPTYPPTRHTHPKTTHKESQKQGSDGKQCHYANGNCYVNKDKPKTLYQKQGGRIPVSVAELLGLGKQFH